MEKRAALVQKFIDFVIAAFVGVVAVSVVVPVILIN